MLDETSNMFYSQGRLSLQSLSRIMICRYSYPWRSATLNIQTRELYLGVISGIHKYIDLRIFSLCFILDLSSYYQMPRAQRKFFENDSVIVEYYEEILSHVYVLTTHRVSPAMWQVFDSIYEMFKNDGYDYFTGRWLSSWSCAFIDSLEFPADYTDPDRVFIVN